MRQGNGRKRMAAKSGKLILGGDLVLAQARELADKIRQALEGAEQLTLEIRSPGEVDLSFLQLLCSAHRCARAAGKTLLLGKKVRQRLAALAREAGFAGQGCPEAAGCFWRD